MAALTQYLWEDYLRNSDVGQAAILEAEREEAEHKQLLEANDKVRNTHFLSPILITCIPIGLFYILKIKWVWRCKRLLPYISR